MVPWVWIRIWAPMAVCHTHDRMLLFSQRSGLAKDGGRDGRLADVVDKGGLGTVLTSESGKPASLASSSDSAAVRRQWACSSRLRGLMYVISLFLQDIMIFGPHLLRCKC